MFRSGSETNTVGAIYYGTPGTAAPSLTLVTEANGGAASFWCETLSIIYYNGKYYGFTTAHSVNHGYRPYILDTSTNTLNMATSTVVSPGSGAERMCSLIKSGSYWVVGLGIVSSSTDRVLFKRQLVSSDYLKGFGSATNSGQIGATSSKLFYQNDTVYCFRETSGNLYLRTSSDSGATWSSDTLIASNLGRYSSRCGISLHGNEFFAAKINDDILNLVYSKDLIEYTTYTYDLSEISEGVNACGDILKDNSGYYLALYWNGSASLVNSIIVQLY